MNRPVLGTISILALLGGGLYLASTYKDKPADPVRTNYEAAAARSAIQSWLELPLPGSASNVHCMVENLERTKLVYACFDLPTVEMVSLFDRQTRFPMWTEMVADPALLQAMQALSDGQKPWWQIGQVADTVCAQKAGKRNVAPAALKWRTQVCAIPISETTKRVFIAFSEEPVEEK